MTPLWGGLSPQPPESRVWRCPRGTLMGQPGSPVLGEVGLEVPPWHPHGAAWAPSPERGRPDAQ